MFQNWQLFPHIVTTNFALWSPADFNEIHITSNSSCMHKLHATNSHTHTHLQPIRLSLPRLWNLSVPPLSYFSIYRRRAPAVSRMPAVSFCFASLLSDRFFGGVGGWEVLQFKSLCFSGPGVIFIRLLGWQGFAFIKASETGSDKRGDLWWELEDFVMCLILCQTDVQIMVESIVHLHQCRLSISLNMNSVLILTPCWPVDP